MGKLGMHYVVLKNVFFLLTEHHLPLQGFFASCSVMISEVRGQSAFCHFSMFCAYSAFKFVF